jgi:hypothetical protein
VPEPVRDPDEAVDAFLAHVRRRMPRFVARYLLGVERVPLPMPALLDFQFYAPEGTILLSDRLPYEACYRVLGHQLAHLVQGASRFRRRTHRGLYPEERVGGESRYFPWADVDHCRERDTVALGYTQRDRLILASPSCPGCGRSPDRLAWTYFISPPGTWQQLAGCAGWMGLCDPCHEQVAFFLDRCN